MRSICFEDPNGTPLEIAYRTETFDEPDVKPAPATPSGMPVDA